MNPSTRSEAQASAPGLRDRYAWLPIPLLMVAMAGLWVAELRISWPFPPLYWLTNYATALLAVGVIVVPAARSFRADAQLSVLLLGIGMLLIPIGVIAGAIGFTRNMNTGITIYNTAILLSAVCHLLGVAGTSWRRVRLGRPTVWIAAGLAGCVAVMGLVSWAACSGRMPVFFITGQGVTLLRSLVLGAAVVLFVVTAGLLWQINRHSPSPFFYWYAQGLVLLAAGLTGTALIAVGDSPLQWVTRLAQALGTVYLCVAVLAAKRIPGAQPMPLEEIAEAWRKPWFLVQFRQYSLLGWGWRYGLAPAAVVAAMAARQAFTLGFGPGLPTYITFYPAVMMVGLLGGLGPGLLATVLAGCSVDYWILPPMGSFVITSRLDRLGMVIFMGMGLAISVVTELYLRHRAKAAAYDRQEALRASETRYRVLFEMITEGFSLNEILFDAEGRPYDLRYLAVNPAFERHTGLKGEDIIGRTTLELFPQAESVWFEFYGQVVRTGESATLEAWFGPLNRCFQVNAFRFEPGVCGVVFFDITERKRAEEALRQNQEWLRVTLASIGDAVIACDTGGRVTFVNPVAASLTGWPSEEAMGQPIDQVFRIINEESRMPAEDIAARVLREGRLVGLANHTALVDRNGREIPIADSAAPILDDHGKITGVVLVFRDVTEAKWAEQELRDSEAALKESDRRKDEFLAVLSHELRNPLAAITHSVYLLDQGIPGSEPARHAQTVIGRQVRLLSRLVDDLLDVTRISRNKIQLRFERMDLVQVARRTVEDHRGNIEAGGVRLDFAAPDGAVWVLADPARVAQMVGNLVLNAGKFTDRDGTVSVGIQVQGAQAMVVVTDTGLGMDEAMLGRLFQPFAQADRSLDRSRGGLGLGLALVKGLAELHGGRVAASSPGLGAGSRFDLILPLAARQEDEQRGEPARVPQRPSHRILVIEDNVDAALTLKMLLEHGGHEVVTAHSGRAGLAKAKLHRPEVIFCDIGLPDTDGYAVAQALRADPDWRPALLVAMTGYGQDEDKRRALEAGFDRHLTKPADPGALERMLAF